MKSGIKKFYLTTKVFLIPIISIYFLFILLALPRFGSYWNFLRLSPFYAGIYFWQSQRADAFNIFSAFLLGALADVLEGSLFGINIMSFLILYIISVQISRRFNIKKFSYSWIFFATAILITLLFKALITSLFFRTVVPFSLWVVEFVLTIAIYPLLSRFFIWIEHRYIHLEERYEKI